MWTKEKDYKIIIAAAAIIGGAFSGIAANAIKNYILEYIIESNRDISTLNQLISLGIIIGLSIGLSRISIKKNISTFVRTKSNRIIEITYILLIATILGIFSGLFLVDDIKFWVFLILIYTYSIYFGLNFLPVFAKRHYSKYLMSIFGAGIGGMGAGIFIGLLLELEANFSISEGYVLFLMFLLGLIGAILGVIIFTLINSVDFLFNKREFNETNLIIGESKSKRKTKLIFILFCITLLLLGVSMGEYYKDASHISERTIIDTNNTTIFQCSVVTTGSEGKLGNSTYNKEDIIKFLENEADKDLSALASLYLLTGDEKWAYDFKSILLEEAQSDKFIGPSGSVKSWQYDVMIRAYYYLELRNNNPNLFSDSENEMIINGFKRINERIFTAEWVDYIYALAFKKIPDGLYENQEIGVGALSVLGEVLEEEYPDLSHKNRDYIDEFGVGWKYNFRNPDDSVFYQGLWIKNAYALAKYGRPSDSCASVNAKNSFEWLLVQCPPNGMNPGYNEPNPHPLPEVMVLGASLFNDGRYQWLANKMLHADEKKCYNIFLEYWDDNIEPIKPTVGSCFIKGTTGIAQRPGPLRPDKIVFRDGWNDDSLYGLLNLRFAGWHSYKATNSFITLMYGEPFVVEDIVNKDFRWLPTGRSAYRDKKIDRIRLNAFQIESEGLNNAVYDLIGFGSSWSGDPPQFAEVIFFNSTPSIDFSKTRISNWHGWTHDRVSILVKDNYFIVFDNARSAKKQKVAVIWHLKGDVELKKDSIKLSQNNYSLTVHHPYSNGWYQPEIFDRKEPSALAGYIHDPDIDFYMISENKSNVGFITLFYPHKDEYQYKIEKIDVANSKNQCAYPKALGVKVSKLNRRDIIGASFEPGEFVYEHVKTDADIFVLEEKSNFWHISFEGAKSFKIISDIRPLYIRLNDRELIENTDWEYISNVIVIKLPVNTRNTGFIEIEFGAKDSDDV